MLISDVQKYRNKAINVVLTDVYVVDLEEAVDPDLQIEELTALCAAAAKQLRAEGDLPHDGPADGVPCVGADRRCGGVVVAADSGEHDLGIDAEDQAFLENVNSHGIRIWGEAVSDCSGHNLNY